MAEHCDTTNLCAGKWSYTVNSDKSIRISVCGKEPGRVHHFKFCAPEPYARLAVSAPSLYEALEEALAYADLPESLREKARKALRLARGESSNGGE